MAVAPLRGGQASRPALLARRAGALAQVWHGSCSVSSCDVLEVLAGSARRLPPAVIQNRAHLSA